MNETFDMLDDEVRQEPLERRKVITELAHDYEINRNVVEHCLDRRGKILQDENRSRTAVAKLMLELTRLVEGIDVDDRHAGSEKRHDDDRILNKVRQHDGDAVAAL